MTFDDGPAGLYDYAFPCLQKYSISATAFVVEEVTRRGKAWDDKPVMSADQIKSLIRAGIEIGSHGRNHLSLASSRLDHEQLVAETAGSKAGLEDLLLTPIRCFSYPYGTGRDVSPRIVAAIREAGYKLALTSVHGKIHRRSDPLQLHRIKVERSDSLSTFKELLCGGMDQWAWIDKYAPWLQVTRGT